MMHAHMFKESAARSRFCPMCGIPADSQYFDESKVAAAPAVGREVLLARFELAIAILRRARVFCAIYRCLWERSVAHSHAGIAMADPGEQAPSVSVHESRPNSESVGQREFPGFDPAR